MNALFSRVSALRSAPGFQIKQALCFSTDTEEAQRGIVKWFNETKGFGFIKPESGDRDIFVHFSAIESPDGAYNEFRVLEEGEEVSYISQEDNRGRLQAVGVRKLSGGSGEQV